MKWFKHMSDLPRDEGVSRYLDAAGKDRVTAYGFLMFLLEAIASRMNAKEGHLVCTATYSILQWGRITYSHPNRVTKYLCLCEVIEWVQVKFEEDSCKVSIPRMVEWRDETTRKSGVQPERFAQSREDEIKEDKRESKDEGALSGCLAAKDAGLSPPPDFKITQGLQEWATKTYPKIDAYKETEKFRLYEFNTSRSDWDAQWKLWIIRAAEHQENSDGNVLMCNESAQIIRLGADLKIERKEGESDSDYCDRVMVIKNRRFDELRYQ